MRTKIRAIWHDLQDKPLRTVPVAFISGDVTLAVTAGLSNNLWLLFGNAAGAICGFALAVGGDGGDPATRTPKQIQRAQLYERMGFAAVGLQGACFIDSGVIQNRSPSEVGVGLLCMAGAFVAIFDKTPAQPQTVVGAAREALKGNFKKSAAAICDLPAYKKAGLLWLTSQAPLFTAYMDNGLIGYLAAISLYVAGNLQIMRSWRAEMPSIPLPKPQP